MASKSVEQERVLWAAATIIERDWGDDGSAMISRIIDSLIERDDVRGVEIWLMVEERFEVLTMQSPSPKSSN